MSGFFTFGSQGADQFTLPQLPPALGPNGGLLVELPAGALPLAVSIPTPVPVTDNGGSLTVDGSIAILGTVPVSDGGGSLTVDGTVAISGTVPVSDGGGSLTVDGSVSILGTVPVSGTVAISGTVPVSDAGGSLTVDGTVAISGTVPVSDGGGSLTIDDGAGSITVDGTVAISGTVPVSDGGGSLTVDGTVALASERAEDSQHASGHTGLFVLAVRNDTPAVLTSNDGDYSPVSVDSRGRLLVASIATAVPVTDNAGSLTVDGTVAISGTVPVSDGGGSLTVDGSVSITGAVDTELPAAAALSDTIGNPTAPMVGAAGMLWTGAVWVRHPGSVADGALVNLGANNDVHGTVAHDAVDSGNPVKVGGQAVDYAPSSSGERGRAAVGSADRADLALNLRGEQVAAVKPEFDVPTNVAATYNNTTTTTTSAGIDCWPYRQATLAFELTLANTPTDIRIDVEVSLDGTNYAKLMNGPLGSLVYSTAAIGAGIKRAITFPIAAAKIRLVVTATGTSASNTITLANPVIYMRS